MPVEIVDLLAANVAVANGAEYKAGTLDECVIQVVGIVAGDIVQLQGSNDANAPTNWAQIGDDITEDDLVEISALPNWIRARRDSIAGAGTVTVRMKARYRR